ncbi:MAG: STAS domain-containing protein [Ruminococcus sp.]|nr:STAS domain-containing protein [Ruminococcus sp.]
MLQTDYHDNVLTAYIDGEIDHDTAARLRTSIDGAAQSLKPGLLCLDFGAVRFMDSSGVGLVMGRYRQMKLIGGRLRVVNIPGHIYRIFAMSGLEGLGVLR